MQEYNEAHYTRSVMELSDILTVTSSKPIFSKTGLKLVGEDVQLDSAFFKRLALHSMTPPFEQCLVVKDGITHDEIAGVAQQLLQGNPMLARMAQALPNRAELLLPLQSIPFAAQTHFLLTLARERRPQMFAHSIMVALISIYLGMRLGLAQQSLVEIASAGLFHDLGELRFNPQLFDSNFRLSEEERQQIYAHPATTHRILANAPALAPEILNAVLQHHERLDGSGYPSGLRGNEISRAGQILALAEVASSKVCQGLWGAVRLEMICKLNSQQFASNLLGYLSVLYGYEAKRLPVSNSKADRISMQKIHGQINKIALAFNTWQDLLGGTAAKPQSAAAFIQQHLASLNLTLQDAGISLIDKQFLTSGIEDDPRGLAELDQLSLEIIWQIRETMLMVKRRWPKYATDMTLQGKVVIAWVGQMEDLYGAGGRLF